MKTTIILLMLAISLQAGWKEGNEFVEWSKEIKKDSNDKTIKWYKVGNSEGYIEGIRDTLVDLEYICIPARVTNRQIYAVVLKYIDDNPTKWNNSASSLVWTPLMSAFPCKKKAENSKD